ncbi:MAG TPA: NACHT domain-containing protein [Thermoanaerobaculia bacterium]|nr:NACHT domain-containing protein [Thermoanaerobaculia bacterium]
MEAPAVRLLASTNNARGDLFTRLVKDLFFALGYDALRLNVHKTGREIDLRGTHRFEGRDVIAECKAEKEPIGGRDANTFLGVLTRERDKTPGTPINAYFVSLSGFRETEVEQELQTSVPNRLVLLNGSQVVGELERSRVLVSRDDAIERAGRCAAHAGIDAVLEGTELLGHEIGYVWAVFYARGKERTHFALIHADGTPLADGIARRVVQTDRKMRGSLPKLTYLAPPPPTDRIKALHAAMERYFRWIDEECGFIQLDGLPADTDLSATRMKLERLFVPLKVALEKDKNTAHKGGLSKVVSVGAFLGERHHAAIVAKPGSGKSTLLKRLAIAYAFPMRRVELDDELPEREWMPLFLRCRELRDRVQRPILDLFEDLPRHAGMSDDEAEAFREHVHEGFRSGKNLLLIDGLDEIADEGSRRTFAQHLRTFVAIFPNAALIVTSREAGFRFVAGVMANVCALVRLAPFEEDDVERLCERWHVEVVADNEKVRLEARELAQTIWGNERIRALAENPLMLTTLLVVRRCIGELPTRRVELYREAVRVLIRTWNTEGFAPLDLNEALAQLSYVGCAMTEAGQQQIGQMPLLRLLRRAREEIVPELQFTQISPEQFIDRIEYRSSLLMQTGHAEIDGQVQPVYEFRHLTFQEYLTARGLVEEQYPGRDEGRNLVDLLEPHFGDERWREIIPLTAILMGRKADPLIQRLTFMSSDSGGITELLLIQCLLDEVQAGPATLRAAMDRVARDSAMESFFVTLHRGKFGALFDEVVERGYFSSDAWQEYWVPMGDVARIDIRDNGSDDLLHSLLQSLRSNDLTQQVRAALSVMNLTYEVADRTLQIAGVEEFLRLRDALGNLLNCDDLRVALASAWALVWTGNARLPNSPPSPDVFRALYRLWRFETGDVARLAGWALTTQPLLPRDTLGIDDFPGVADALKDIESDVKVVLAWYCRVPLTSSEFCDLIEKINRPRPAILEILQQLGSEGRRLSEELAERHHLQSLLQLITSERRDA